MVISDIRKIKNDILAYCVGDDLPLDNKITAVETSEGKKFYVKKTDCNISFSGQRVALISFSNVNNEDEIPLGQARIII